MNMSDRIPYKASMTIRQFTCKLDKWNNIMATCVVPVTLNL